MSDGAGQVWESYAEGLIDAHDVANLLHLDNQPDPVVYEAPCGCVLRLIPADPADPTSRQVWVVDRRCDTHETQRRRTK